MRLYETAFLIAPNLPEEETEQLIQKMAEVVTKKKGKMVDVDKWGKRKLAYQIQKHEDAFYVFLLYEGSPDIPSELERRFKQDENILRFLTVKQAEKEELRKKKRGISTKKTAGPRKKERPEKTEEKLKEEEKEEKKEENKGEEKEKKVEMPDLERETKPLETNKEEK